MAGGLAHGHLRELLWLLAVGVDILGGIVGFATPWLGRSRTADWTIVGSHIAERCQAFILIALGESIVIIGATLSAMNGVTATSIAAFIVAGARTRRGYSSSASLTTLMLSLASRNERSSRDLAIENSR